MCPLDVTAMRLPVICPYDLPVRQANVTFKHVFIATQL